VSGKAKEEEEEEEDDGSGDEGEKMADEMQSQRALALTKGSTTPATWLACEVREVV